MSTWRVVERRGTVAELHAVVPLPAEPTVWLMRPVDAALVLGSTQSERVVDRAALAAAGLELVRRSSGGGAVLVEPGGIGWIDVVVPRADPRWVDDVGQAALGLGVSWQRALADLGIDATVHSGPMVHQPWSALVCFAGTAPGEVVGPDGAKYVGISQRRGREGARFSTAVLHSWQPDRLAALFAAPWPAEVAELVGAVGVIEQGHEFEEAVVRQLAHW
jgi:lipoate-protein ligase A